MMHKEDIKRAFDTVKKHNSWRSECINMIASENVTSPLVDSILISDFMHRYAEGDPYKRYYQGTPYIDEVETKVVELAKKLFNVDYVEPRSISGGVANLAALSGLTEPGDSIGTLSISAGAHISHLKFGLAGICGLDTLNMPFDNNEMNIDVDSTIKLIQKEQFKLIILGGSLFLFAHPIKELKETCEDNNTKMMYDAAHVLGLMGGGQFQDPIREGIDVITSSTHKTLPGPQGGIILSNNEEDFHKIKRRVFPGIVSNHHLARLPGLIIALCEAMDFGKDYAKKMISNAKYLAQFLYERDFDVVCEHKGFTESHQVVVDAAIIGGGTKIAEKLEKANIILNKNLLPWDPTDQAMNPSGIRMGVAEMTRVGMEKSEMEQIAEFMHDVIFKNKSVDNLKKEIAEFRRKFNEVKFTYDENQPIGGLFHL